MSYKKKTYRNSIHSAEKSIVEINQLSPHTSSDAEQVDQSSQELREQASSLRDQIKQFKT